MTTDLQRLENTPEDDLVAIANDIDLSVSGAREQDRDAALGRMNQRTGFVGRFFPTPYQREKQRIAVENMGALARYDQELVTYYTEVKLALARKQGNVLIAAQGIYGQRTLAAIAAQQEAALSETINASRRRFLDQIDPEFDYIARFANRPDLFRPAYASIQHQIAAFFGSVDTILDGYVAALNTKAQL